MRAVPTLAQRLEAALRPVDRELEKHAEKALRTCTLLLGGLCFKLTFLGVAGAPDRILFMPGGRLIFVELKKPGGKLEASQKVMFPKLERLGFTVHVVVGIDGVRRFVHETLIQRHF